jgi:hypothetical protein
MSVYIPIHHDAFTGESWDDDALLDTRGVLEVRLEDGNGATVYVRFDDYLSTGSAMKVIPIGPFKSLRELPRLKSEFIASKNQSSFNGSAKSVLTFKM